MEEKISILMTSYNYAQYIGEAIESVINQTYKNWELIIIDDGSTDNSLEIINEYAARDNRIKLYTHPNNDNLGLCKSTELGIQKCDSKWISFLESDDKFSKNALEEKLKIIEKYPQTDLVFSDLEMFQDEATIKNKLKYFDDIHNNYLKTDYCGFIQNFRKIIYIINIIPTFSVVTVRKDVIVNCNFKSKNETMLDYYLWSQMAHKNIYYLNKKLTFWRMHANSFLNTYKTSWLKEQLFAVNIYYNTIAQKPLIIKILLLINCIRTHLIYLKINRNKIKINFFSGKFVLEKSF